MSLGGQEADISRVLARGARVGPATRTARGWSGEI